MNSNEEQQLPHRVSRLEFQMERVVSDQESEKRTRAEANRAINESLADLGKDTSERFDRVAVKQDENRTAIVEGQRRTDKIIFLAMGAGAVIEIGLRLTGK